MVTVKFWYSVDGLSTTQAKYIVKEYQDGALVQTHDKTASCSGSHGHEHDNGGVGFPNKRTELKLDYIFSTQSGCSVGVPNQFRLRIRVRDVSSGLVIGDSGWKYTSGVSSLTIKYTYLPSGIPEGAPTYLETLDKLDQWSSAHYIPNSGDRLNL